MTRDCWSDHAKGIGIVLVVYGHVARGLVAAGLPVDRDLFALVDSFLYAFHMPLFFFLSGIYFLESFRKAGPVRLLANKVDSLLYPYVIWSLLHGGLEVAMSQHTNGKVQWADVLAFPWHPRTHFWFLYALFLVFVVAIVLYGPLRARRHGCVMLAAAVLYLSHSLLPTSLQLHYVAQNLVFFCAGIFCSGSTAGLKRHAGVGFTVATALLVALQWTLHMKLGEDFETGPRWLLLFIAIAGTLSVVWGAMLLARAKLEFLRWIGTMSFGIYLMHTLAGAAVRIVLQKTLQVEAVAVHLIAGVTAGLLLPIAVLWILRAGHLSFLLAPGKFRPGALVPALSTWLETQRSRLTGTS